jgi:hypothetical protein
MKHKKWQKKKKLTFFLKNTGDPYFIILRRQDRGKELQYNTHHTPLLNYIRGRKDMRATFNTQQTANLIS